MTTEPRTPGTITRRRALQLGGLAVAGGTLAACGGGSDGTGSGDGGGNGGGGGKKVKVTMFLFAGTKSVPMAKEFGKEFEASHPNVTIDYYENSNLLGYPKMLAARQVDPDKPLVNLGFFNAQTSAQGDLDQMWNELDYASMPNAKDILPILQRDNRHGIGIGTDQVGPIYNTQEVRPAPTSWTVLWDPKYRDKLAFFDNFWQIVFVYAKLNGGGLDNMQPGWDFWRDNAGQIRLLVSSNDQFQSVLSNGTASIAAFFNGAAQQWRQSGAPIDYAPPSEGGLSVPTYLQSAAGSSQDQQEVCQEIINELISPKWCTEWSRSTVTVPANTAAKLPEDLADLPSFGKDAVAKLIALDWATVAKNLAQWNQLWDQNVKAHI